MDSRKWAVGAEGFRCNSKGGTGSLTRNQRCLYKFDIKKLPPNTFGNRTFFLVILSMICERLRGPRTANLARSEVNLGPSQRRVQDHDRSNASQNHRGQQGESPHRRSPTSRRRNRYRHGKMNDDMSRA